MPMTVRDLVLEMNRLIAAGTVSHDTPVILNIDEEGNGRITGLEKIACSEGELCLCGDYGGDGC